MLFTTCTTLVLIDGCLAIGIKVQNRLRALEEKLQASIESSTPVPEEKCTQGGQKRPPPTLGATNDDSENIEIRIPDQVDHDLGLPASITEELLVSCDSSNQSHCQLDFMTEDYTLSTMSPGGGVYNYVMPALSIEPSPRGGT